MIRLAGVGSIRCRSSFEGPASYGGSETLEVWDETDHLSEVQEWGGTPLYRCICTANSGR
jgi:hypothetical protein